ncbi:hypothetical protein [Phytobacter sp. V91]|uniref:hypothetical protein n=1 Tax=Phytobacter sp. V91 TaxID=3369425 RepID=UPI003F626C08
MLAGLARASLNPYLSISDAALNLSVHDKYSPFVVTHNIHNLTFNIVGGLAALHLFAVEIHGDTFATGDDSLSRIIIKHGYTHNGFLLGVSLSHGKTAR